MRAHTPGGHMHGAAGFQGSGVGFGAGFDGILQEEIKELEEAAGNGGNVMAPETWAPADQGGVHITVYRGRHVLPGSP